jgi:hypothetical protein
MYILVARFFILIRQPQKSKAARKILTDRLEVYIIFCWHRRTRSGKFRPEINPDTVGDRTTALLWVTCPLVILISMNLIVIGVSAAGWEFR